MKLAITPIPEPELPKQPVASIDHSLVGAAAERVHDFAMEALKVGGGIHVETLMSSLGALAGFAAQNAVWRSVVDTGRLPLHGGFDLNAGAFTIVTTNTGDKFYFGNIINSFLVPEAHEFGPAENMSLTLYLTKACENAGAAPVDLEEIKALFAHTSGSLASDQFGIPRLPEQHTPHLMPRQALDLLWPTVVEILSAPLPDGRRIPAEYWPLGIGLATAVLIDKTKDVLSPTMSMRIVLEAAVPMSKVDPETVPWTRETIQ